MFRIKFETMVLASGIFDGVSSVSNVGNVRGFRDFNSFNSFENLGEIGNLTRSLPEVKIIP